MITLQNDTTPSTHKLIFSVILTAWLTACGGGGSNDESTTTDNVTESTATKTASSISIVAGDDQTGITNSALEDPIVVALKTETGEPVEGAKVSFTIKSGSGSVSTSSDTSDTNGEAATQVQLGENAGALHITAAVEDNSSITTAFRMTSVDPDTSADTDATTYNSDWSAESHEKGDPNYSVIFDQENVNTIEITLTTAQWNSIREDMKVVFGSDFGSQANLGDMTGGMPSGGDMLGGMPNGGGMNAVDLDSANPAYVTANIKFQDNQWKKVGFRLKGNSSLMLAWMSGNYKLPFRLKFNEFDDIYPAIKGQRFYGFKDLSFSPAYQDNSLIREKVAADVLRAAGIPAAQTSFYKVYVDIGQGLKYCGVYTAVEVIDDTMVASQFGEDDGNIYKPTSKLSSFSAAEFEKKNNESANDYSDVSAFIDALNSPLRTSNPAQWRSNLESVFNVDHFLKWLAINNAIVNWDTYGSMAHNYYLYNHSSNYLTWIPWDHNESFSGNPGIIGEQQTTMGMPGTMNRGLSLSMNEISEEWPLIRYVADDDVYFNAYKTYLKEFKEGVFTQENMDTLFDKYYAQITPYAIGENGEQLGYTYITSTSFEQELQNLKDHVKTRKELVSSFTQ